MSFLSRAQLCDLFLSGRFRRAATMSFVEIGGAPGYQTEAVIADKDGRTLGECCLHELEALLEFGETEKANTGSPNPNLEAVRWAVGEMKATDRRVAEMGKKLAETPQQPSAQIYRFPTCLRVVPQSPNP